ncbi:27668_t:CDS:2 [Gigaspora margarita]|uniref:27668_t:CDS:1 n=1 Tax=Gigaspora margarita TaxID=4874 RepID=A0ABN7UBC3_GIGMA|nr:27668_t:CDS:2 [Gigaspora margarita]
MFTITVSGTPIILWCLVRGSTAIFDITIGRDNHVSELKEVIKKVEEPVFDSFDPDQLKLLKLKNPINDEHISDIQNLSLQDDEDENDDIVLMKVMRKIVAYWPENQAPPEDLIHVIVEAPEQRVAAIILTCINAIAFIEFSVAKRSYYDMQIDRTSIICDALIQPFSSVPSQAEKLTSLINAPLTRKLPVSFYEEIKFPQLADFIETKNDECGNSIIRIPLQIFHENLGGGILPIDMDRSSIAGTRLRFFAIDGSSNINSPSRLVALSNQLDINNRRDRISILCIVVNIARIMRTVSNTIPEMIVPLGKRLKTGKSMITFLGDSVEKRVSVEYLPFAGNLDDRNNFLSKLYEHAKGHTGLVQVKESPSISRQRIYKVVLETRGHFCQVRNEDEARVMSQCVLTGLSWLHKGGYVHRDIRLPNILFIPGDVDCKYVLIDFEHANVDGLVTSERLKDRDDKTLTKHNEYTAQSDLYQFGKMLRNLNTVNSEAGKKFLND